MAKTEKGHGNGEIGKLRIGMVGRPKLSEVCSFTKILFLRQYYG